MVHLWSICGQSAGIQTNNKTIIAHWMNLIVFIIYHIFISVFNHHLVINCIVFKSGDNYLNHPLASLLPTPSFVFLSGSLEFVPPIWS